MLSTVALCSFSCCLSPWAYDEDHQKFYIFIITEVDIVIFGENLHLSRQDGMYGEDTVICLDIRVD